MGSSVKSVFDGAKKETDRLGKAVNSLYDKQAKVVALDRMKGGMASNQARLQRLYSAREVAKAEAARSSAGKTEIANLKKLNAEIARTEKALKKEQIAVLDEAAALKRNGIDTKNLTQERKRLGDEIAKTERRMQRREQWGAAGARLVKFGTAVTGTAVAVGVGLFAIAEQMAMRSRQILTLSTGLGMNPEYLQTFEMMGQKAGVAMTVVDGIMTKMGRSIERAGKGKGVQFEALHKLGIRVGGLRKLKPERQIEVIAEALNKYRGNDKGSLFGLLTGRSTPDALRFMSELAKGFKNIEVVREYGLKTGQILTVKELENGKKFIESQAKIKRSFIGLKNIVGAQVLPAFAEFFDVLSGELEKNMPEIRQWVEQTGAGLRQWVESGQARKDLKKWGDEFSTIVGKVEKLVDRFGAANTAATTLGLVTFGPMLTSLASTVIQSGLLLSNLRMARKLIPGAAGGGEAEAVAAGVGLGTVLTGAAALTIPFFISGDSRRPDPKKYKPLSESARLTSSKAELAKAQAELEEQKRSRKEMYSPERGGLVGGWMHEKWYASYIEYLEGKVKFLKESVASNTPSLVPNSPLRRQPAGAVVNNPAFNFYITAAPGANAEQIGGDIFNNLKSTYPALFDGMLHD